MPFKLGITMDDDGVVKQAWSIENASIQQLSTLIATLDMMKQDLLKKLREGYDFGNKFSASTGNDGKKK